MPNTNGPLEIRKAPQLKCLACQKPYEEGASWYMLAKYPPTGEGVAFCSQVCIIDSTWGLVKRRLGEKGSRPPGPTIFVSRDLPGAN